jgi:hypothetical protein
MMKVMTMMMIIVIRSVNLLGLSPREGEKMKAKLPEYQVPLLSVDRPGLSF